MSCKEENESLENYLKNKIFNGQAGSKMEPDKKDVEGFDQFMERYMKGLAIEQAAVDAL